MTPEKLLRLEMIKASPEWAFGPPQFWWLITELEAAWAEVERLKQEHDYEIIAIDDARKAAEKERDEHRGVAIACERRAIAAEADRDRLAQRVKVLEEALNSMVRVAARGHVPDDVFDAMARIRSAALAESPKQMEEKP